MCSLLISSIPYTLEKVQADYPWAWGTVREKPLLRWCNNKAPRNYRLFDFPHEAYLWSGTGFSTSVISVEFFQIYIHYNRFRVDQHLETLFQLA